VSHAISSQQIAAWLPISRAPRIPNIMLSYKTHGSQGPTIVLLHWLGGSARTWTETATILAARGIRSIAIDLPGFGDSIDNTNYSVEAMAYQVLATLHTFDAQLSAGWLLAGHSMGGKVAAVLTRSLLDHPSNLALPTGLILVSPSPAGPEPMKDSKRADMLTALGQSTGDAEEDRKRASTFVDDNTGKLPLVPSIHSRTVNDVLRMSRAAFTAWLTETNGQQAGSREDWSARVGVLPIPSLIFAGTEDAALGPNAQREHTLTHFNPARLITLDATGHLGPVERPTELAAHILDFARSLDLTPTPPAQPLTPAFQQLLNSDRTAPQTRDVLYSRLNETSTSPQTFNAAELRTLHALIDTVIPDATPHLAARLDQSLAQLQADGWRFDDLPSDAAAWHRGLSSLDAAAHRAHAVTFLALTPNLRRDLLLNAQQGKLGRGAFGSLHLGDSAHAFTATQMQHWFEDVRSELTRLYVSDPQTLDRIGFTGFADDPTGFTQIRLEDQFAPPEELEASK
jgi:pimeloyl-ACP methyl ester carboxylesterase